MIERRGAHWSVRSVNNAPAGNDLCTIWFLRHGESVANAAGRFAGQGDDSPLTLRGRTQARQAAHRLPGGLTWIVSSPLRRARESATIVRDELGLDLPVELDDRLIQYDMGSATGLPMRELTAAEMVSRYGAEDPDQFCARILAVLDELSNRSSDGLVVSHSGVARMILARAAGLPAGEFRQVPMLENAAPFLVERHPDRS